MMKNDDKKVIHETVLDDIVDEIDGVGDLATITDVFLDNILNRRRKATNFTSIAKAASNLVMTFPVIVEESVSLNASRLLAKAIEKKAVTLLQALFAALSAQALNSDENAFDFVRKVHGNLNIDDIEEYIQQMETYGASQEQAEALLKRYEKMIQEDNKLIDTYVLSNEDYPCLENQFTFDKDGRIHKNTTYKVFGENKDDDWFTKNGVDPNKYPKANMGTSTGSTKKDREKFWDSVRGPKAKNQREKNRLEKEKLEMQRKKDERDYNFRKKQFEYKKSTDIIDRTSSPEILNMDLKKANEMMPTMMVVNFYTRSGDGSPTIKSNAVVGVKAKIQYVKTAEMMERIVTKNKDRHGLFNFLRSTTREISFFKDFLFAVDKAKLDAISMHGSKVDPIWKILERRAMRSKFNRYFGETNEAAAITSLVISSDTADFLKKEYDYKCSPADITNLMKAYNIMAFFVVDEVKERVSFIWDDGSRQYETLSFTALERDNDSEYKKIINLLASSR